MDTLALSREWWEVIGFYVHCLPCLASGRETVAWRRLLFSGTMSSPTPSTQRLRRACELSTCELGGSIAAIAAATSKSICNNYTCLAKPQGARLVENGIERMIIEHKQ